MRIILSLFAALLLVAPLSAFAAFATPQSFGNAPPPTTGSPVGASTLPGQSNYVDSITIAFVQTASSGTIAPAPGKPNQYLVTLFNVGPYVTYYTHRPNRTVGLASVSNFIGAWGTGVDSFAIDSPNAVIYAGTINGQANQANVAYVVQLSNPQYNLKSNTMTYLATPLNAYNFVLNQFTMANIVIVMH